ncbi:MAG: hypothetical protein H6835_10370 [Planctomycetes bacterium]|nr:hypothetical protein [Planctomycetota bacterium]
MTVFALAASPTMAQTLVDLHGEVVLACGDPAPGLPGVTVFDTAFAFDPPVIDANGTMVFRCRLDGAVSAANADDRAVFMGRANGDLQLVVQCGTQAPGLPAGTLLRSSSTTAGSGGLDADILLSPFGELVWFGSSIYDPINPANTPTTSDSAAFWGPIGGLTVLAREGEQVPVLPAGVLYGSQSSFSRQYHKINSQGRVALQTALTGAVTSADDCVFLTGTPGALEVVAREGDAVDGSGLTWSPVSGSNLSYSSAINDYGQILLDCKFAGPVTASNDRALAIWTPGVGATILTREGDQAHGMAPGIIMTGSPSRGGNSWNNSGNTAWLWTLNDGGVTITALNDRAIFYGGLGGVALVVQEGDPTGLVTGERFGTIDYASITSNEAGTIAFASTMVDAAGVALPADVDGAVFVGTTGNWTVVLREGDVVAAVPPTVNGPWVCTSIQTTDPNLNSRGQMLLSTSLNDGATTLTHWLIYDPAIGLQLLRDTSETYTTVQGTGQATTSVSYVGTQTGCDGSPCWFNNNGDFAYRQSVTGAVSAVMMRGHSGNLIAKPSSMSAASGGTQTFVIDAGPSHAFNIYALVGSMSGTRPGTQFPAFGPLVVPLVSDSWTQATIELFNSSIYSNTLWITDANGRATATFNLPPATGIAAIDLYHAVVGLDLSLLETFVTEPSALRIY